MEFDGKLCIAKHARARYHYVYVPRRVYQRYKEDFTDSHLKGNSCLGDFKKTCQMVS